MPSPSARLSLPRMKLGVRASDRSPCLGLAGGSQRSPRVPAEGSEFLLLVCCAGGWKAPPPAQGTPPPQQPTVMDKPGPPQCS